MSVYYMHAVFIEELELLQLELQTTVRCHTDATNLLI